MALPTDITEAQLLTKLAANSSTTGIRLVSAASAMGPADENNITKCTVKIALEDLTATIPVASVCPVNYYVYKRGVSGQEKCFVSPESYPLIQNLITAIP